ncbi:hypothetical protein VYU27_009041 [Nannochloropsis oceanica]
MQELPVQVSEPSSFFVIISPAIHSSVTPSLPPSSAMTTHPRLMKMSTWATSATAVTAAPSPPPAAAAGAGAGTPPPAAAVGVASAFTTAASKSAALFYLETRRLVQRQAYLQRSLCS